LFSCVSSRSWGVGEIADIPILARWLREAGFGFLQFLPINEMAPGQQSPYGAISAMAIDPLFISLPEVDEFAAMGGESALEAAERDTLAHVRAATRVDYAGVRTLKGRVLRRAFERFDLLEWRLQTERAAAFRRYAAREAWWLDDYALYRALHTAHEERGWMVWETRLAKRQPRRLARARVDLALEIRYRQYLQWLAHSQWERARRDSAGVALFGDLPFMVDADSADIWAHQSLFRLDGSVGVPPDAFSATGQRWGLPVYQWAAMAAADYSWLRSRARRAAELFDGFRVDHLVGFYRTYVIPDDGSARHFTPADQPAQLALGEQVLRILAEPGSALIAEDLGTVPDFVRASLVRLGVPGFRVQRWEREWEVDGKPYHDPLTYPAISVATSGTHDTETMAEWWEALTPADRRALVQIDWLQKRLGPDFDAEHAAFTPLLRDTLLELLYASGSDRLILPMQDVFGWSDRINTPGTVSDDNWSWRLACPVDRFSVKPEARERARTLSSWSEKWGRK
jgi:4-alpha-glucanotransferase